jgi:hypothetical protein
MRQRGCRVDIGLRRRVGDAEADRQQHRRRHQRRQTMRNAGASAIVRTVAAAFAIRSGCVLRWTALVRAVIKHAVMEHAVIKHAVMEHAVIKHAVMEHAVIKHAVMEHAVIRDAAVCVRCCRVDVLMTGRFGGRFRNSGVVVRTSRMHRRHRTTDAVRHQGEAEQGMQQERAKAHGRSVLPAHPARSRAFVFVQITGMSGLAAPPVLRQNRN